MRKIEHFCILQPLMWLLLEHPHQYVQKIFHFAHLKPTFLLFILHTYFYKTPTSVCLLYTFIQIKYSFFLTLWTITVRGERNEKRVRWREERKKKNKKIIYTVNSNRVYIHSYCSFARLLCIFRHFYKDWCGGFWVKMCKIEPFCIFEDYPWVGVVAPMTSAFVCSFIISNNLYPISTICMVIWNNKHPEIGRESFVQKWGH